MTEFTYDQLNSHVKRRLVALRLEAPGEVVDDLYHWIYRLVAAAYQEGYTDGRYVGYNAGVADADV